MTLPKKSHLDDRSFLKARRIDNDRNHSGSYELPIDLPCIEHCDFLRNQYILNNELTYEKIVIEQPFGSVLFRDFCLSKELYKVFFDILDWIKNDYNVRKFSKETLLNKLSVVSNLRNRKCDEFLKLEKVRKKLEESTDDFDCSLIRSVFRKTEKVLSRCLFYRFVNSKYFDRFLQWKWIEMQKITNDNFKFYRILGKGTYGEVYGCKDKLTNKIYACKVFYKARIIEDNDYSLVMTEKNILSKLTSRFLINLIYAYETKESLHLILTVMNGGDLKYHIYCTNATSGFSMERARFYASEILLGLEFLHKKGIIHRDCKASNVLMDGNGHVRISDFGLSKILLPNEYAKGFYGTNGYIAPEIIQERPYTFTCDWYSYGCLVYEMIEGQLPFTVSDHLDDRTTKLYDKVLRSNEKYSNKFDEDAYEFCKSLLEKCPTKRCGFYGAEQVRAMRFFKMMDWEAVNDGRIKPSFVPNESEVYSKGDDLSVSSWKKKPMPKCTEEDKQFYKMFSTGIESIPWQESIIESGRFREVNKHYDNL